jgi:hypothetical protein
MDVRGKHLFGIFLDPERLFVVGCEQAFGTPVVSTTYSGDRPLRSAKRKEPG